MFAFARDGVGTPEEFGLRLARHFAGSYDWITGARVAVESYGWDRIAVGGRPHDHAFSRNGGEVRTAVVTVDGGRRARARRADRPRRPQDHRLGVLGLPARPVHDAGRDARPDPGHRGHRPLALHRHATWTSTPLRRRPDGAAGDVRRDALPRPAAVAVRDGRGGAGAVRRRRRDPAVDAEQAPLPAGPVGLRAGQPDGRGRLPRRRPALRADRGHGAARRRPRRPRSPGRAPPASAERVRPAASMPMPPSDRRAAWTRRSAACASCGQRCDRAVAADAARRRGTATTTRQSGGHPHRRRRPSAPAR